MKQFFIRILSFLRVKPVVGGLEISDSALHFAILSGKNLKSAGLRLPPGVVVGGQIKDREQFVGALRALHYQILGEEKNRNRISVIISLSSIGIYTQVFNLPMLEGESLEKAVELNIQMISPLDFAEAYSGWQFAKKDTEKSRLEVLSAFVSRNVVDEFVSALGEGGFLAVAIESHALSLARLLKDAGKDFDATKPYIMLSIDGGGLDILIIRHEQLHFDYFNSWRDIQGDAKEISADAFKAAVIRSLHQVVNFSNSHWREPVTEILFTATGFKDEAVKIIEENFSLKTRTFELSMGQAVAPDWFVALGASARGQKPRRSDNEISLLGINAREEFGREQVLGFLRFWRILMPAAIAIFLVAFFGTNLALGRMQESLKKEASSGIGSEQFKEAAAFESQITSFNNLVELMANVELTLTLKTPIAKKIFELSQNTGVSLSRLYYQAAGAPISVAGHAKSLDDILAFKKLLESDPGFTGISLPLSSTKITPQGADFSMTFSKV